MLAEGLEEKRKRYKGRPEEKRLNCKIEGANPGWRRLQELEYEGYREDRLERDYGNDGCSEWWGLLETGGPAKLQAIKQEIGEGRRK